MAKFVVNGCLTISCYKVIEADSEEEAREKAMELSAPSLCHQCDSSGKHSNECWTLNGFDDHSEIVDVEADDCERGEERT